MEKGKLDCRNRDAWIVQLLATLDWVFLSIGIKNTLKAIKKLKIIELFEKLALLKKADIGVGLGSDEKHNEKLLKVVLAFLEKHDSRIFFFGTTDSTTSLSTSITSSSLGSKILFIDSENPETIILEYLTTGKLNSIIRGSMSSSLFLQEVKKAFNVDAITRLTLLETFEGYQLFYGPVGVDECNTYENKKLFIEKALVTFRSLGIEPIVSVLSGGRRGDLGRDGGVDRTIKMAENIVKHFKKSLPDLRISHDEILIEQAIENASNLLIAPEGISGNLIYRTLVHLGGGKAHGAIYMGLPKVIIDTSRVGLASEIAGALLLALALS